MRLLAIIALAAAVAAPVLAEPPGASSSTLSEVVAHGLELRAYNGSMSLGQTIQEKQFDGSEVPTFREEFNNSRTSTYTFKPDGMFIADVSGEKVSGAWLVRDDILCTSSKKGWNCSKFPTGKKSGDSFRIDHALMGGTVYARIK